MAGQVAEAEFPEDFAQALDEKPQIALDFLEADRDVIGNRMALCHKMKTLCHFSPLPARGARKTVESEFLLCVILNGRRSSSLCEPERSFLAYSNFL